MFSITQADCVVHGRVEKAKKISSKEATIQKIAEKLEPGIAKKMLSAFQTLSKQDLKKLASAIDAGDVNRVLNLIGMEKFEAAFGDVREAVRDAVKEGGSFAAKSLVPAEFVVAFDIMNQNTVEFIRRYELNLIREIGSTIRENVRTVVQNGLAKGLNPRTTARDVREVVGLTKSQAASVQRFRKELETFHLKRNAAGWGLGKKKGFSIDGKTGEYLDGIMERRLRDFRYDRTLIATMKNRKPLSPSQIDAMVARYRERWLKYRSETIARTESLRAVNVGAREAFRQAVDAGKFSVNQVRRFWATARDERVRLTHRRIPKMNEQGVALDQPFATPDGAFLFPPIAPNCRCTVFHRVLEPEQVRAL